MMFRGKEGRIYLATHFNNTNQLACIKRHFPQRKSENICLASLYCRKRHTWPGPSEWALSTYISGFRIRTFEHSRPCRHQRHPENQCCLHNMKVNDHKSSRDLYKCRQFVLFVSRSFLPVLVELGKAFLGVPELCIRIPDLTAGQKQFFLRFTHLVLGNFHLNLGLFQLQTEM